MVNQAHRQLPGPSDHLIDGRILSQRCLAVVSLLAALFDLGFNLGGLTVSERAVVQDLIRQTILMG